MQGFLTKIAQVVTSDGRNVKLIDPVDYIAADGTHYRIPRGVSSDGISSPPESWPVRPPFGQDWLAGILHDSAYRNTLQIVDTDGNTTLATLPKDKCDDLIREAALSLGDTDIEADALFYGVRDFGWKSFDVDRS